MGFASSLPLYVWVMLSGSFLLLRFGVVLSGAFLPFGDFINHLTGVNGMNRRALGCGREVVAMGEEGSLADTKERLRACFGCVDCSLCAHAQAYFKVGAVTIGNIRALDMKTKGGKV